MKWNADLYQKKHHFVTDYGKDLLSLVPKEGLKAILDIGCGTGTLTARLAEMADKTVGIDSSPAMIEKARASCPQLEFQVADACSLPWVNTFDLVFSNAVFHWIRDQRALLASIRKVLRPEGVLLCEFGAEGNVVRIQQAYQQALELLGYRYAENCYFPSAEGYRKLLEEAGFKIVLLDIFDRPTPLSDGEEGLANWTEQFLFPQNSGLSVAEQTNIHEQMAELLKADLWDGAQWIADYRRIRVIAMRF